MQIKLKLTAPINRENFKIKEGDTLTADVVVTNKNIGHSFPPELRDFYEAYVEFTVADAQDKVLYKSGFIKPDGYLDEKAHTYKTWLVKEDGNLQRFAFYLARRKLSHKIWRFSQGRSDLARYKFKIPQTIGRQIKVDGETAISPFYAQFTRITRLVKRSITRL